MPARHDGQVSSHAETTDSTRALLRAARGLVAELDLDEVLDRLLATATQLTGARYAAIGVLDRERRELERFVTRGIGAEDREAIGALPRGHGLLGVLIEDPRPLRLHSLCAHPRSYGFPAAHPPMETFLGVPIIIRGQPWGNLYLAEKAGGADFTEADEEATILLADWAAVAVDNARSYEESERRRMQAERSNQALEATAAIAMAVGGETDLDRILELIVKRGRALVHARALLILLASGDQLQLAAGAGELEAGHIGTTVPVAGSLYERLAKSHHPIRVGDLNRASVPGAAAVPRGRTALGVPLIFRGQPLGALIAIDHLGEEPEFSTEEERLLVAFSASAATAVATARAAVDRRVRSAIEAGERERRRWARELHDDTLQEMAALSIELSSSLAAQDPEQREGRIRDAIRTVQRQVTSLRELITDLRPSDLDELGLGAALEELAARVRRIHDIEVETDIDLGREAGRVQHRLSADAETTIFRLAQEALNNVGRHAAASSAWLRVIEADGHVVLEVIDNGKGFDPARGHAGFGLVGMRERAELVGGQLMIDSKPGRTLVRARTPLSRHDGVPRDQ